MKNASEAEVLHRMASLCSLKEYCIQDIRRKIREAGLEGEECERIIKRLCSEKFIDEERYTRAFTKDKLRFSKWGRIKVRYELQKKGIPTALADAALGAVDETEYRNTLKEILILKNKSTKGKTPQEVFAKLFRFAAGRGFESPLINSCLKEVLNTDSDETCLD